MVFITFKIAVYVYKNLANCSKFTALKRVITDHFSVFLQKFPWQLLPRNFSVIFMIRYLTELYYRRIYC